MKNLSLLIIVTLISLIVSAQPKTPNIDWQHIDSDKAGIEAPNATDQQTSSAVFDIDKDGINDFIICLG